MLFSKSVALTALGFFSVAIADGIQHPLVETSSQSAPELSALLGLHKSLVEISSITGSERNVSDFLAEYLEGNGFTVETQNVDGERQNIYAYPGKSRKTRVLVTSHIDTVPPFWPYERKDDEIWGRGAVDAKGSVATQIAAVELLLRDGKIKQGDVSLLYVVGEEVNGAGMRAVNDLGLSWETAIFGEPTELKLAVGHKGVALLKLTAKGVAGHSGYPELGVNAIDILVKGLSALQTLVLPSSKQFGNSTVNVGVIEGGVATNVIPASASAEVLIRIAAGTPEEVKDLVEKTLHAASPELNIALVGGREPVALDYDFEGFETDVMSYGTDIAHLNGSHKKYLYGPGSILVAHSDHEHVGIRDLEAAVEGYKVMITRSLES